MGPAPGSIIQQPPMYNPAHTSIPIDPVLLNPNFQSDSHTPSQPTLFSIPNQSTISTQPSSSQNDSPFTPAPLTYDFSALTTPTPMPSGRLQSKRAKPHPSVEAPAKCLKQAEHHMLTQSSTKNTLVTQSGDDLPMDLFNDEIETTVCDLPVTDSPFLFTALTDQGYRNLIGSSLVTDGSRDFLYSLEPVEHFDQLGRTCFAKSISRKTFCHSHRTSMPIPSFLIWVIVTLILLCLVNSANATPTSAVSLSLFALNTNGFVHPSKIDTTNRAISHRNPDILVITETKTNSQCSSKMSYTDYQFFEEHGTPVIGHHLYKWGVILGIKKGITVSQRIPVTHPALVGRLIAVDIVIPVDTGQGFTHRVIAAYAPWDVDDNTDTAAFWTETTKLCANATNSWTLLGDLNTTITQAEQKSGGTDAHTHFNNFLRLSKGCDLWSKYP